METHLLPTYVVRTYPHIATADTLDFPNLAVIDHMKDLKCNHIETTEESKHCVSQFNALHGLYTGSITKTTLNLKSRSAAYPSYYKPDPSKLPTTPPTAGFECYNYVIGRSKISKHLNHIRIFMRLGKFDDNSFFDLVSCYVNKITSTAQQESLCGIKHIQMASTDMEILFSGVIIIETENIIITPMSGTFIDNVLTTLGENPILKKECIDCLLNKKQPDNLGKLMMGTLTNNDCKAVGDKRPSSEKICKPLANSIELYNFLNIICTEYALLNLFDASSASLMFEPYTFDGKHNGTNCLFRSEFAGVPDWVKTHINNPCLTPYIKKKINADTKTDERCTQDIPQIMKINGREAIAKALIKESIKTKKVPVVKELIPKIQEYTWQSRNKNKNKSRNKNQNQNQNNHHQRDRKRNHNQNQNRNRYKKWISYQTKSIKCNNVVRHSSIDD